MSWFVVRWNVMHWHVMSWHMMGAALVGNEGVADRACVLGILHVGNAAWDTAQEPWNDKEESHNEEDKECEPDLKADGMMNFGVSVMMA